MDPALPETTRGQPSISEAALSGLCPKCGSSTLFAGLIRFADQCQVCGLNYTKFNVGDGPAAFLTLIVGTLVVVLAIWVQLAFEPPFWVHIVLWIPITAGSTLGGLRIVKAALLAGEYRNRAKETGRKVP